MQPDRVAGCPNKPDRIACLSKSDGARPLLGFCTGALDKSPGDKSTRRRRFGVPNVRLKWLGGPAFRLLDMATLITDNWHEAE